MARRRRQPSALVSSAAKINLADRGEAARAVRRRQKWQEDAWAYFDLIGEIKFAEYFLGNAMSKLELFIAERGEEGEAERVKDAAAEEQLERLADGPTGHANLLREAAINLSVPGECYLIGLDAGPTPRAAGEERWGIYSIVEVTPGDPWRLSEPLSGKAVGLSDDSDFFTRIWLPHPRNSQEADSPLRGVLSTCEEILSLERAIRAALRSRLHNGILFLPSEMSYASTDPTTEAAGDGEEQQDPFMRDLVAMAQAAIQDESSAAALIPLIVRADAESLAAVRHEKLDRELDASLPARMEAALRRLAQGLNVPVEVIMGIADINHWGAWAVQEDAFKSHIEPLAIAIVESLTMGFLRPTLEAAGHDRARELFIWYDPSKLVSRSNRATEAGEAWDRYAISWPAYRKALQWSDDDAPSEEELRQRAALARGRLDETQTGLLLDILVEEVTRRNGGPEGPGRPSAPEPPPEGPPPQERPSERPPAATASATPNPFDGLGARLAAVDRRTRERLSVLFDAALERALERAGARLRSRVRGQTSLRNLLTGVENIMVPATVGAAVVAAVGTSTDELLEGSFQNLERRYLSEIERAQTEALNLAGSALSADAPERAQAQARFDQARADSWSWVRTALLGAATAQLFSPSANAPPQGEFDAATSVPFGVARQATQIAGGTEGIETLGELMLGPSGRPAGGIGTGGVIEQLLLAAGGAFEAFQWEYGTVPRRTFEPHLRVDGVVFERFDDPRLRNNEGWPPVPFYTPGDHNSCLCDLVPIIQPTGKGPARALEALEMV